MNKRENPVGDPTQRQGGGRNVRSSEWNAVPDLIMEDKDGVMITEADTKQKRDEVAQG